MVNVNIKPLKVIFVPLDCISLFDFFIGLWLFFNFSPFLHLLQHQKVPLPYHYIISILQETLMYKLCPQINVWWQIIAMSS